MSQNLSIRFIGVNRWIEWIRSRESIRIDSCRFFPSLVFGVLGRTVRITKHAKFQLNWFKVYGAPGDQNDCLALTWLITLTTVYALTCYTVWQFCSIYEVMPQVDYVIGTISLYLCLQTGWLKKLVAYFYNIFSACWTYGTSWDKSLKEVCAQ